MAIWFWDCDETHVKTQTTDWCQSNLIRSIFDGEVHQEYVSSRDADDRIIVLIFFPDGFSPSYLPKIEI